LAETLCSGSRSLLPATSYFDSSFYGVRGYLSRLPKICCHLQRLKNSKIIIIFCYYFAFFALHEPRWWMVWCYRCCISTTRNSSAPSTIAFPTGALSPPPPTSFGCLVTRRPAPSHHPHSPTTVTCHFNSHNYEDINDLSLANIGDLFIQVVRHTHAPKIPSSSRSLYILYLYIIFLSFNWVT
jgi:hypothetical protein